MIPHERSLVEDLANEPFVLLGVNSDPDCAALKQRLAQEQMTWRHWFDGGNTDGPIASAWNVSAWPTTYLIDAEGVIRFKGLRDENAEAAIRALLAQTHQRGK